MKVVRGEDWATGRNYHLHAGLLDGFHHTRSMHRALNRVGFEAGVDLHRLVFPGMKHNAGSWASRVSMPLQLLFPKVQTSPGPARND